MTMQTKDPALTKTPIDGDNIHNAKTHDAMADSIVASTHIGHHDDHANKSTETFQETVIGTRYASDNAEHHDRHEHPNNHTHEEIHHDSYNIMSTDDSIGNRTTTNKGTDTFQETVVGSEHINDGDNPARQPDRRDQEGSAFDDGINEHTITENGAKSEGINDLNRYANIDNAQTRVLNPDEKNF